MWTSRPETCCVQATWGLWLHVKRATERLSPACGCKVPEGSPSGLWLEQSLLDVFTPTGLTLHPHQRQQKSLFLRQAPSSALSWERHPHAHCRNAERRFPPVLTECFLQHAFGAETLINDTYLSSDHFPLFLLRSSLKNSSLFQTLVPPNDFWTMNQLLLVWRQSSMYLVLLWGVLNQRFSNVVHDLLGSPRPFLEFWEVTTIFERI